MKQFANLHLVNINSEVSRPESGAPSPALVLDREQFDQLLAMAEPRTRSELVRYLHEDLARLSDGLSAALASGAPDIDLIRAQSHVLISLSGSVGASLLHKYALELNWAAQDYALAEIRAINARAQAQLALLLDFLAGQKPERPVTQ